MKSLTPKQLENLSILKPLCQINTFGWMMPDEEDAYKNWCITISDCSFSYTGNDDDVVKKINSDVMSMLYRQAGIVMGWTSSMDWFCVVKFGKFENEKGRLMLFNSTAPIERIIRRPKIKTSAAWWQFCFMAMTAGYTASTCETFPELSEMVSKRN